MYARRVIAAIGAFAAVAGTLVACSSSGSGSKSTAPAGSGASGGSGGSAAAKATGAPIVIGNVGTYSGPIGSSNIAAPAVLKAWVKQVNASGGINGHPVKYQSADDQTSTSTALTATQNQVQNSGAIAFVSNMQEATAGAAQSYLEGKKIPVVGGDQNLPTWYQSPVYFATAASSNVLNYGQITEAKKAGVKKLSVWACTDSPTCGVFAKQQEGYAKEQGLPLSGRQAISLAQSSFAAPCLAAKNAGADAVLPNVDPSTLQRVIQGCQGVGYNPTYISGTNSIATPLSKLSSAVKIVSVQQTFPFFLNSGSPALEEYGKVYNGLSDAQKNVGAAQAWAAVKLFEAAAKAGVPAGGTPTSAQILKGLYSLKATTLGNLTVPLTYTAGQPSPVGKCWFVAKLADQKFTGTTTPVCTTASIKVG